MQLCLFQLLLVSAYKAAMNDFPSHSGQPVQNGAGLSLHTEHMKHSRAGRSTSCPAAGKSINSQWACRAVIGPPKTGVTV